VSDAAALEVLARADRAAELPRLAAWRALTASRS
jgi:hypothetical protein